MQTGMIPSFLLRTLLMSLVLSLSYVIADPGPEYERNAEQSGQKPHNMNDNSGYDHAARDQGGYYRSQGQPRNRAGSRAGNRQYHWLGIPHSYPSHRYDSRFYGSRYNDRWLYAKDRRRRILDNVIVVMPSPRDHNHYLYIRPFASSYPEYKRLYHNRRLWGWLAVSEFTLQILDHLDEGQQREYERALYRATTSPLREALVWRQGRVSGTVTPIWEGPHDHGRYCREFKQDIRIGGRSEIAYGSACRMADGKWEIVQ